MSKTNAAPSETDIAINRSNISLAATQSLVRSWLPPHFSSSTATSQQTPSSDLSREDPDFFNPPPERAGLGAVIVDSELEGLSARRGPSNQALLEKMLGKKAARGHVASRKPATGQAAAPRGFAGDVKPPATPAEESDEEEGRASMVGSKTKMAPARKGMTGGMRKQAEDTRAKTDLEESGHEVLAPAAGKAKSSKTERIEDSDEEEEESRPVKKRGASYLDQLLAEKANKKKKKQKAG